jgi:hypothetical protein
MCLKGTNKQTRKQLYLFWQRERKREKVIRERERKVCLSVPFKHINSLSLSVAGKCSLILCSFLKHTLSLFLFIIQATSYWFKSPPPCFVANAPKCAPPC